MVEGVSPDKDQTMEEAMRLLDAELMVPAWRVFPGVGPRESEDRDPNAPYWWTSDEEASSSFLAAMGQVL